MSMNVSHVLCSILIAFLANQNTLTAQDTLMNLPVIKKDAVTGFSNGGWALDRYPELERLDPCLLRCQYRGFKSFASHVGLGVFSYNLVVLSKSPNE